MTHFEENTLEELLKALPGRRGSDYLVTKRALKRYLSEVPVETFRRHLILYGGAIEMGQLISAGLGKEQQDVIADLKQAGAI